MMQKILFEQLFSRDKPVIGMIHVFPGDRSSQLIRALRDLESMQSYLDGVMVENYGWGYHDANIATHETAEILREITEAVVRKARIPVGINVLPNDCDKAYRIANETGARFVQMDHVTGDFVGCKSVNPRTLSQLRRCYPEILLLGGIHPKYYELVDPCTSITESALKAMKLCDAIVVTGEYTGGATSLKDLRIVKRAVGNHPVIVGSGLTARNAKAQLFVADGAICGTALKVNGVQPDGYADKDLIIAVMKEVEKVRRL
jgi:hypothetical protein